MPLRSAPKRVEVFFALARDDVGFLLRKAGTCAGCPAIEGVHTHLHYGGPSVLAMRGKRDLSLVKTCDLSC